jgi:hypothetical protein
MRCLDFDPLADQNLEPTRDSVKRIALGHVAHGSAP